MQDSDASPGGNCHHMQNFCYDWLNVNPVHVLKTNYCEDLVEDYDQAIFYDVGKEYLQIQSERTSGRGSQRKSRWSLLERGASLEFEGFTGLDVDCSACPLIGGSRDPICGESMEDEIEIRRSSGIRGIDGL